jgi:hypothetical protein
MQRRAAMNDPPLLATTQLGLVGCVMTDFKCRTKGTKRGIYFSARL